MTTSYIPTLANALETLVTDVVPSMGGAFAVTAASITVAAALSAFVCRKRVRVKLRKAFPRTAAALG